MKNFTFFFVFFLVAFLSFAAMAQSPWILQRASGLPNSVNPQVVFSAVDENVCWGITTNNTKYLRTTNGGTNWTVSTITGSTGSGSSISAIDADTAYVALSSGIFKTTDAGLTWTKQTTAFPSGGTPNVIHFFDANNGVCAGDPNGGYWEIYTTTDGGTNWTRVPSGNIPSPLSGESGISDNEARSVVGNNFWFSTFSGSLYRTTDRGITWTVSHNVIGSADGFDFAFKDSLNGLACTFVGSNRISKTSDGGITWTPILPVPSPGLSLYYIAYVKGTIGSYIITSNNNIGFPIPAIPGSAYSNDDGATWTKVSSLPLGAATFASDRIGWSGGVNDSIYKWDSDLLITSVKEINSIAENFTLKQNYPNPFNPNTRIQFSIRDKQFVTLKIYDVLGREVAALVNEEKQVGSYEVNFNASQLSSGVYFYKLQAGSFVETKKMMLLK